ncbi:hypothetical protein [Parabacteroides chinchillae]|uniref:Plasmid recombination enzyme n=1 Tax=Parabacteroides chinchillae TaxID=871327 RepID=A0A8G2F5F8_9BACT|nr:hypothetical protein [Parabacteroides chinchillae]SEG01748.1 hypothetical protein SAMN05444001_11253 [Parabacteroides chinchillae]
MKTGIKFKPCNVGTAEAHNRRIRAYCEAVARKFGQTYFWEAYRHLNVSWRSPTYPKPLPDVLEDLKVLVKQKTGRAMQCKDVEYTDRKTGKKRKRSGSSAIREGCPPIKSDTKIKDFDRFVKWLADKGITVISIDLHHDEGHADPLTDDFLPNHHAHIIVDWMDHATGKSIKLNANDCKEMQTVLAESLGMERGTPKEDSGIEGLNAIEYKEKMARENNRRLTAENDRLESHNEQLGLQVLEAEKSIEDLEQRRKEKKKALDEENGSALMSGVANLFGKGRFAEIERENERLTDENSRMKTDVARMEAQVAKIPMLVERQVRRTIADNNEAHAEEIRTLNATHSREQQALQSKFSDLSRRYREMESGNRMVIDNLKREKETMLARMEAMLSMLGGNLEKAIRALIQFARSICSTFTRTHKEAIVPWLITGNDPKKQADFVKLFSRPFLDDAQFKKGYREMDALTSSFPSVIEELEQPQHRGMRR